MKKTLIGLVIVLLFIVAGCDKKESIGSDPYAGGKQPLGIKFAEQAPYPSEGRAGTAMTFKVYGIQPEQRSDMRFLINGLEADLTEVTDTTITAILPQNVSTGGTRLVIDGQIYPGPICQVSGNLRIDPTFNAGVGANSRIASIQQLNNGWVLIGGSFTDYNGFASTADINGIARITANGQYVSMNFGEGAKFGSISNIQQLDNNDMLISGNISMFNKIEQFNHIALLNLDGSLKGDSVEILNLTSDPSRSKIWAPSFNGGTNLPILKTFFHAGKVTAIGSFKNYYDYFYERSTYDNLLIGSYPVGGVVRMNINGTLDDTFNVNHSLPVEPGQVHPPSYRGIEGFVADGLMQDDGKLIVVGRLTRYNDTPITGHIFRINTDGSFDETFDVGTGANDGITTISKTPSGKMLLTGTFNNFAGQTATGLVLLNSDGSVDNSFQNQGFSGGSPNFARQLSNGKILVAGSFKHYGDVIREGLCILEQDGTLAEGYNNTGKLDGTVVDMLEGVNGTGQRTVTLVGSISRFNGKNNIGNIVRLSFVE